MIKYSDNFRKRYNDGKEDFHDPKINSKEQPTQHTLTPFMVNK